MWRNMTTEIKENIKTNSVHQLKIGYKLNTSIYCLQKEIVKLLSADMQKFITDNQSVQTNYSTLIRI